MDDLLGNVHYRLKHRKPIPCPDLLTWGKSFGIDNRKIRVTHIGPLKISTIFLGFDHDIVGSVPVLFETMIFDLDETYQTRCETHRQSLAMHRAAVVYAKAWLKQR